MEYESLAHRAIDFHKKTFSPFLPVKSDIADRQAQQQMHGFLYDVLERLYGDPGIIGLPDVPDERFMGLQKDNPELGKRYGKIASRFIAFYEFLIGIGRYGIINDDSLCVAPEAMRITKPKQRLLEALGLVVDSGEGCVIVAHRQFRKLSAAWKLLSSPETEHQRFSVFIFSRCVFDTAGSYVLDILKQHFEEEQYLFDFIDFLEGRGFSYSHEVSVRRLDIDVRYTKKMKGRSKPWIGLSLAIDSRRSNVLDYGMRIMEPVRFLAHYDQMDDGLKALMFEATNECNGCGYCRQTDRSKPVRAMKLTYADETLLKCPMFPQMEWRHMSEERVDAMKRIVAFNEEILTAGL